MTADIPEEVRTDPELVSGCVAGATSSSNLRTMLTETGFEELAIDPTDDCHEFIRE